MPLAALRLVNPPRRRRRAGARRSSPSGTVRMVRTKTGVRYLKKVGNRWQFAKKPKAKSKKRNTVAASPRRRRRASAAKVVRRPKRIVKRATKRAASPRKRRSPVAKRRTVRRRRRRNPVSSPRRRRVVRRRRRRNPVSNPRPRRRRRRNPTARANPRHRRVVRRRRRNPTMRANPRWRMPGRDSRGLKRGGSRRRRRNPWSLTKTGPKSHTMTHSRRPKRKYRAVAMSRGRFLPRIMRKNPLGTIKKVLPIYGGFLAIRVLHGLFRKYVNPKLGLSTENENKYGPLIPAGVLFLASTLLAPRVLKGKPKIVEALQVGSAFALFNTIVKQLVLPAIPSTAGSAMETIKNSLNGYDDVGVMGYGMGSYIADPTGYSLPGRGASIEPGVGLDAHEAMALDEYIADGGMGFDVAESLAGTEIDYMQRGGAGGSLSKTVFTD